MRIFRPKVLTRDTQHNSSKILPSKRETARSLIPPKQIRKICEPLTINQHDNHHDPQRHARSVSERSNCLSPKEQVKSEVRINFVSAVDGANNCNNYLFLGRNIQLSKKINLCPIPYQTHTSVPKSVSSRDRKIFSKLDFQHQRRIKGKRSFYQKTELPINNEEMTTNHNKSFEFIIFGVAIFVLILLLNDEVHADEDQDKVAKQLIAKGDVLRRNKKFKEAIDIYKKVVLLTCDSLYKFQAYYHTGNCYYYLEQDSEALTAFDEAIKLAPEPVYIALANNTKGAIFIRSGREIEAIEVYDKMLLILNDIPTDVHGSDFPLLYTGAYVNKGSALQSLNRHEEAVECFELALKYAPDRHASDAKAKIYYNLGFSLSHSINPQDAISIYDKAINSAVTVEFRQQAILAKGDALARIGHYQDALICYRNIARSGNDANTKTMAYYNMGVMYNSIGGKAADEKAIENYQEALRLYLSSNAKNKDTLASIYNNLAISYDHIHNREEAMRYYDLAIQTSPDSSTSYYNKGSMLGNKGEHAAAIDCYKEALKTAKKKHVQSRIHHNMGVSLHEQGEYQEAIIHFDEARQLAEGDNYIISNAHYHKGLALFHLKDYQRAIENYKTAIHLATENKLKAKACNNLGNTLATLERFDEAFTYYDSAIELAPEMSDAYYNKGRALLSSLRKITGTEGAIYYFVIALEKDPTYKIAESAKEAAQVVADSIDLEKRNIDKEKSKYWGTEFHEAASLGDVDWLREFINVNIINAFNGSRKTPLMLAVENDRKAVIEYFCGLPEHLRPDFHLTTVVPSEKGEEYEYKTAMELAVDKERWEIFAILLRNRGHFTDKNIDKAVEEYLTLCSSAGTTGLQERELLDRKTSELIHKNIKAIRLKGNSIAQIAQATDMTGKVVQYPGGLKKNKEETDLNGWEKPEDFLSLRIACYFNALAEISRTNPREKEDYNTLKDELISDLETLRSFQDALLIKRAIQKAPQYKSMFIEAYTSNQLRKVLELTGDRTLCYTTGYTKFPMGHIVYVNMLSQDSDVVVRVDNLGEESKRHIDQAASKVNDTKDESYVKKLSKPFTRLFTGDKSPKAGEDRVRPCLTKIFKRTETGNIRQYLQDIYFALHETISPKDSFDKIYVGGCNKTGFDCFYRNLWPERVLQIISNCVARNHDVGVQIRLSGKSYKGDDFFSWLESKEVECAAKNLKLPYIASDNKPSSDRQMEPQKEQGILRDVPLNKDALRKHEKESVSHLTRPTAKL